jgi:hypothetical protein
MLRLPMKTRATLGALKIYRRNGSVEPIQNLKTEAIADSNSSRCVVGQYYIKPYRRTYTAPGKCPRLNLTP